MRTLCAALLIGMIACNSEKQNSNSVTEIIERYDIRRGDTCLVDRMETYENGSIIHSFYNCSMTEQGFLQVRKIDSSGDLIEEIKALQGDTVFIHYDYSNRELVKQTWNTNTARFKKDCDQLRTQVRVYDSLNRLSIEYYMVENKSEVITHFSYDKPGYYLVQKMCYDSLCNSYKLYFFQKRTKPIKAINYWQNPLIKYGRLVHSIEPYSSPKHTDYYYDSLGRVAKEDDYTEYKGKEERLLNKKLNNKVTYFFYEGNEIKKAIEYSVNIDGRKTKSDEYIYSYVSLNK